MPLPTSTPRRPRRQRWPAVAFAFVLLWLVGASIALDRRVTQWRRERAALEHWTRLGAELESRPAGWAWLARALGEDGFEEIDLLDLSGLQPPVDFERLSELRFVDSFSVRGLPFRDADLLRLAPWPLEHLDLGETRITGGRIDVIAGYAQLEWLSLASTPLELRALEALAHLPALEVLWLSRTAIDGPALEVLRRFPALRELSIDHGRLEDEDLAAIDSWPGLSYLDLSGHSLSVGAIAALRRRLAGCVVLGP